MSDKRDDRFVEELLDSALARYSAVEPRTGLEERVLDALRTSPPPALPFDWRWWPLLATSALVVVLAGVYALRRPAPAAPATPSVARIAQPPAAPAETPSRVSPRARQQPASPAPVTADPRQSQFPAPAPLSEQERLLLRYAEEAPPEGWVTARLGQGPLERLRIEPLSIPPLRLQPGELQKHPN